MKFRALMVLPLGLLIAALAAPAGAGDKELKKLEGTWLMISGEEKGEKLAEKVVKGAKLTIVGAKHTVNVGEETIIGTHKLDAKTKPMSIDATDTEGPFKDKSLKGIYKVVISEGGAEFTVCFAPPGQERPKEFTTKSGTGELLHVWKRQKQ